MQTTITTEGVYAKGVVIPKIKPTGRRAAIITFLPLADDVPVKSDAKFWQEMEPTARRIRKKLLEETYPDLYVAIKRKRA